MSADIPVVVLAAPGAGGAQVARALAEAGGRSLASHDEVADVALGDGHLVRSWCRKVLWRRERDWTCPVVVPEDVDDADPTLDGLEAGVVLFDVALWGLVPVLAQQFPEAHVVVVVRSHAECMAHLDSTLELDPGAADDLLRAATTHLVAVAEVSDVVVVDVTGLRDLAPVAAALVGEGRTDAELPRLMEGDVGVEEPASVPALRARARPRSLRPVRVAALPAVGDDVVLERFVGPRTAARRVLVHEEAQLAGSHGPALECTRARGLGAWSPSGRDLTVAYVDSVSRLHQTVGRHAPASFASVLLPDVLSWCTRSELEAVLRLAMEAVAYGGVVVLARSEADDVAGPMGRETPDDAEIMDVAVGLGLVPLPVTTRDGVRCLAFGAHTAVAGTIADLERRVEQLEGHLTRRTEQRDVALQRLDALRTRRVVRVVLGVADALGRLVRMVRGGRRG